MKCKLVNKPIYKNYLEELLKERGVENVEHFLQPTEEDLESPKNLSNLVDGFEMLQRHLDYNDTIALVADCDVDGFTSAAIIYQYIKHIVSDIKIKT